DDVREVDAPLLNNSLIPDDLIMVFFCFIEEANVTLVG
ncbi:hypothetical protein A2U01_0072550, partial [Trifolium medium]|nr:hypothetical protein [Trifolium medium]